MHSTKSIRLGNKVVSIRDTRPNLEYSLISRIIKPIHVSMQIFGVFFFDTSTNREERASISKKWRSNFSKYYCVCFTAISCLNILRYIPAFWVGIDYVPDITVWRIINLSWLLQCFLNRIFMLRACLSRDHLQSFYQNFDRIITETSIYSDSLESRSSEMKRMIFFRTSVTWFGAVISFAGIIFQSVTDFNKDFAAGITNPFPQSSIAALLLFSGLHLWETGAWLFPILLQSTLFTFLGNSFSTLNTNLIRIMEDNDKRISQNIKDLRRKHLQLCKTVAILEQDTSYLLTGTYVTNVFLICFIVYQMVTADSWPIYSYVSFLSWVLMNVTVILTISHTAAKVNEKAHSHLEYLYDVDMSQASPFESLELQMFLSKLNGPPLGFTVLGFVTITKEFILTLGGIIMTYFFLLLQFKL